MSKSDILYVKGMDMLDTECLNNEDDMWDDTQLTSAYDKALRLANIEVAKRVAMSTNTSNQSRQDKSSKPQRTKSKTGKKKEWQVGEPCRAVYEGDGLEYEAFVQRVISSQEYVVKFLGYENTEIVSIDSMKSSHGKAAQQRQIEQSADKGDDTDCSIPVEHMDLGSDRAHSPESSASHKKDKKKKRREPHVIVNGFHLPDMTLPNMSMPNMSMPNMPMPMPNMPMPMPMPHSSKIRNFSAMDMPLPHMAPPPLPFPCGERVDCEDQAISSMLLSWYMSGYYTGLYQGLKRSKDHKRRKD